MDQDSPEKRQVKGNLRQERVYKEPLGISPDVVGIFDALGGKAIPKVAQLSEEYAALLAEKKERYEEYKAARKDMIDYQTAKQNVDRILGLEPAENGRQKRQETER